VLLHVLVAQVLQVELLLLLGVGSRLLEAVQLLVVVLTHWMGLLSGLGAWLVLVGLTERVRGKPLVQRQSAGVQWDALQDGTETFIRFISTSIAVSISYRRRSGPGLTCVMEDRVGEMVGENCLEWCLRDSAPMGRMSGDSWARLRGDVLSGAWPCPLSSGE